MVIGQERLVGTGASERVNRMVNGTSFTMGPTAGLGTGGVTCLLGQRLVSTTSF